MTPTTRELTQEQTNRPEAALSEPLDTLSIELGRISAEIQSINSGFQAHMCEMIAGTRVAIERQYRIQFEKTLEEMREQTRLEVKDELETILQAQLKRTISEARAAMEAQYETRFEEKVAEMRQQIQLERAELEKAFQEQLQETISESRAAMETQYQARFESAAQEMRDRIRREAREEFEKGFQAVRAQQTSNSSEAKKEAERIVLQIESIENEIAAMLDDPEVELSKVMRKRTEQAELKAYLNGLRYSMAQEVRTKAAGV